MTASSTGGTPAPHPPPPLRIGVTGHRFLEVDPALPAGVDRALDRILSAWPGREVRVLTMLADGADRLVLERIKALRPGARLALVLPADLPGYLGTLSGEASRRTFTRVLAEAEEVIYLPKGEDPDAVYRDAGEEIIRRCDVLLALWDGRGARGPGGTGEVVEGARRRGLPLAWVLARNAAHGAAGPDLFFQGEVRFERFPGNPGG